MEKVKIGVIGCGRISGQYLDNLAERFSYCLDVAACADIVREAAESRADEYGIPQVLTVDELLADPEIEIVVNLTIPAAHHEVSMAALEAGKHVYTEKPLSVTREEGQKLIATAKEKGLRIGGAPDTFLGAGLQTCRKLLDEGWIGRPIVAQAITAMGIDVHRYHTRGVGPMFDMGPYYVTALVTLLGAVTRATGTAQTPFPEKTVTDPHRPDFGDTFEVETPTTVAGVLDFEQGCAATLVATCDSLGYNPRLVIYGTEGILTCNDPNMFHGPVLLKRKGDVPREAQGPRPMQTREMPLTHDFHNRNRGLGVADMAYAIRNDRPHRASGELMYHVHDIMHAVHDASRTGEHVMLQSRVDRPVPMPAGVNTDTLANYPG